MILTTERQVKELDVVDGVKKYVYYHDGKNQRTKFYNSRAYGNT